MSAAKGDSARDELKEIALNLFTIEVSTILSSGMTARKMPPVAIALIDIVGTYYRFLSGIERKYAMAEHWRYEASRLKIISDTDEIGRHEPGRSKRMPGVEEEDGDRRQEQRWNKRIEFYRPLYWDADIGWLSNPERRRNNSGSFKALSDFAKLFRNYLLWSDREKDKQKRGAHTDDPAPGVDARQIAEDLPIIDRIYRHSAILGALVAQFEQRTAPTLANMDYKDIDALSNEELDDLNTDAISDLREQEIQALRKVEEDDSHPWCKRRQWFTQSAKPGYKEPMLLATEVPVTSTQITEIRKIWETGTEQVVMQSVIQMDGDIITRVHPGKVKEVMLHELHNETTATAIKTWMNMAKLVAGLVDKTFNAFFKLLKA
ncbi:MAG: hypothetical protein U9Q81_16165 [Pseudomonadota bacterium]|nr:hypothetical protein [Pseudomonadota bacterium]